MRRRLKIVNTPRPSALINNRYLLHEPLGAGGMGVVFRATDRLTGQIVALKQITQVVYDTDQDTDLALRLAQEFKTLAGLRHPYIVTVLDYGFDERYRPFFTMHYLEGAQNLLEAGQGQSQAAKIDLLLQLLQVLTYLHRQGIIHGDLKPDNVLVVDGRVQVLDFGLAANSQLAQAKTTGGTLIYMAPELFGQVAHSQKSDLYAVGLMAYELLTGRYPFDKSNMDSFLLSVFNSQPDFENVGLDIALIPVLARLLAREPDGRYAGANESIKALSVAVNRPLPEKTVEIRESFLQAAAFVGRNVELAQLRTAVAQELLMTVLDTCRQVGIPWIEAYVQAYLGDVWVESGNLEAAITAYRQAVELRQGLEMQTLSIETTACLARAYQKNRQPDEALNAVEEVLAYLEQDLPLHGTDGPARIFLYCFQVLEAVHDRRAPGMLAKAYQWVQEKAAVLPDTEVRRSFLNDVPWHREILAHHNRPFMGRQPPVRRSG